MMPGDATSAPRAIRVGTAPILTPESHPSLGDNLNGPSLLAVPDPLRDALPGRYMLAFAHHKGDHIRLAFADAPEGPWRVDPAGLVHLRETPFAQTRPDVPQPDWAVQAGTDGLYPHIASPDLHWNAEDAVFHLYYHGLTGTGAQATARATSTDARRWQVEPRILAEDTYLRVFAHAGRRYALAVCGRLLGEKPNGRFTPLRQLFDPAHRHAGLLMQDSRLHVAWSRIGDAPERILLSRIELGADWREWQVSEPAELLRPAMVWEGRQAPVSASRRGAARPMEHALRDPFLFEAEGQVWMIYAGGGESTLCIARIENLA